MFSDDVLFQVIWRVVAALITHNSMNVMVFVYGEKTSMIIANSGILQILANLTMVLYLGPTQSTWSHSSLSIFKASCALFFMLILSFLCFLAYTPLALSHTITFIYNRSLHLPLALPFIAPHSNPSTSHSNHAP